MRISEKKFRRLIRRVIAENTQMAMEYHDDNYMDHDSDLDDEYMDYDTDDLDSEEPASHGGTRGFVLAGLGGSEDLDDTTHSDHLDYDLDRHSRKPSRRHDRMRRREF